MIDRLLEGKESIMDLVGGRRGKSAAKALEAARLPLLALDLDHDGKLTPEERIPAIAFIMAGPFMKNLGAIGFD